MKERRVGEGVSRTGNGGRGWREGVRERDGREWEHALRTGDGGGTSGDWETARAGEPCDSRGRGDCIASGQGDGRQGDGDGTRDGKGCVAREDRIDGERDWGRRQRVAGSLAKAGREQRDEVSDHEASVRVGLAMSAESAADAASVDISILASSAAFFVSPSPVASCASPLTR